MRDIITIFAAGTFMTGYALIAPTIVGAMQTPAPVTQKAFVQRLAQAGGEAPVSAVSGPLVRGMVATGGSALPRFAWH